MNTDIFLSPEIPGLGSASKALTLQQSRGPQGGAGRGEHSSWLPELGSGSCTARRGVFVTEGMQGAQRIHQRRAEALSSVGYLLTLLCPFRQGVNHLLHY